MNQDVVLALGHEALKVAFFLATPMLVVAMIVGISISLMQAVTQINEATLTFIPKIIAIAVVLTVSAPWMLGKITHYATELFTSIPQIIR